MGWKFSWERSVKGLDLLVGHHIPSCLDRCGAVHGAELVSDLRKVEGNRLSGLSLRATRNWGWSLAGEGGDQNILQGDFQILHRTTCGIAALFAHVERGFGNVLALGAGEHEERGGFVMAADKVEILHADFASSASAGSAGRIRCTPAPGTDFDGLGMHSIIGLPFDAVDLQEEVRSGVEEGSAEGDEGGGKK